MAIDVDIDLPAPDRYDMSVVSVRTSCKSNKVNAVSRKRFNSPERFVFLTFTKNENVNKKRPLSNRHRHLQAYKICY